MKTKRSRARILAGSAMAAIALLAVLCLCGAYYLTSYALQPPNNEKDFRATDLQGSWREMFEEYPHIQPWADSLQQAHALRDTFIQATDGTRLHALYAAASRPTDRTAVIVHGYTDNAVRMLMIGYMYHHDLHYNILLPDLRYAGWSGGNHIQMGWNDRLDVLRWMEVANGLYGGSTQMVVHGISMGAATTMMVAGEAQAPYVKCFVEDCGYTSVRQQFGKELQTQFHLPPFPLIDLASWVCGWRFGWNFDEADALRQVSRCPLPMFFIHGGSDDYVPTWMVTPLYNAKPAPKELWIAPGSAHARSYKDYPEEYTRRVQAFTGKYIR